MLLPVGELISTRYVPGGEYTDRRRTLMNRIFSVRSMVVRILGCCLSRILMIPLVCSMSRQPSGVKPGRGIGRPNLRRIIGEAVTYI